MVPERPRFGTGRARPAVAGRVRAMGALLVIAAGMLAARTRWAPEPTRAAPPLVVEVRGRVPAPGFHPVPAPATVRAALAAAGADGEGAVDAVLPPGTRVVVEDGGVRLEPMDDLLVVGVPIDVNRATARALEVVPGLGPARSAAIVAEREENGPFASLDDLERVRGIGPATVARLRPFLAAAPEAAAESP